MKRLLFIVIACLMAGTVSAQEFAVFVSDAAGFNTGPWKILKYDEDGANPEVFIDEQLAWPQDIVFLEDQGTVLISNLNSGRITIYDAETGDYIGNFATGLGGPTRMAFGPDGKLYVAQWNGTLPVLRFERDGTPLGAFTSTGVTRAIGLAWDSDGVLYVSSYQGDFVQAFDTDGSDLGFFISSNLVGPTNLWFDDNGDLLVSDYDGGAIKRFGADGSFKGNFITGLGQPEGIAMLPGGDLLIGNGINGSVKRYQPDGQFVEDFVPSGLGGLQTPNAVVVREAGLTPNPGLNDAWYNPVTDGQGFFINVFPEVETIFVGWFTFETADRPGAAPSADLGEPYHRWLTAIGGWSGSTATLDVFNTSGGQFDDPTPVTVSPAQSYGTITIQFHDCATATLTYDLFAIGEAGEIPIQRIVPDNVALCEALDE